MPAAAAPTVNASTSTSACVVATTSHPAPHAGDERGDAREREQQGAGDLPDLRAAVALALRAQPWLRRVHEPSSADDLIAGDGDEQPCLAILAHVDPRIGKRERPVGARRPILLLGGDEP